MLLFIIVLIGTVSVHVLHHFLSAQVNCDSEVNLTTLWG